MPRISEEAAGFLAAVLTGGVLRLVYIGLQVFRQIVRHSLRGMGIEDLFFWILSAFYVFVQNYHTNIGGLRWYYILGVVGGAILTTILYIRLKDFQKKNLHRQKK